ncbi:MAG: hypothetical protein E7057_01250 [Lentisphaerae bacterium]|nr:hypothetical protein [Lentisphaerota bacterium]
MKSIFFSLISILSLFTVNIRAEDCMDFYDDNQEELVRKKFTVTSKYIYAVGQAEKISSDSMAFEMAENDCAVRLADLIKKEIRFSDSPVKPGEKLQDAIFFNWRQTTTLKYTAKNRIVLERFISGKYAYFAAAYKLDDVVFEIKTPISWEQIYTALANNPDKRDELVFYEIIPETELKNYTGKPNNNIARRYGKNFAAMFAGADVPPITHQQYTALKKTSAQMTSATPFTRLVRFANLLPYDQHICNLLAEKFTAMQMPRCAKIMTRRAAESQKLTVIKPAPVVKPQPQTVPDVKPEKEKNAIPDAKQNAAKSDKKTLQVQKKAPEEEGKNVPEVNSAAEKKLPATENTKNDFLKFL